MLQKSIVGHWQVNENENLFTVVDSLNSRTGIDLFIGVCETIE